MVFPHLEVSIHHAHITSLHIISPCYISLPISKLDFKSLFLLPPLGECYITSSFSSLFIDIDVMIGLGLWCPLRQHVCWNIDTHETYQPSGLFSHLYLIHIYVSLFIASPHYVPPFLLHSNAFVNMKDCGPNVGVWMFVVQVTWQYKRIHR